MSEVLTVGSGQPNGEDSAKWLLEINLEGNIMSPYIPSKYQRQFLQFSGGFVSATVVLPSQNLSGNKSDNRENSGIYKYISICPFCCQIMSYRALWLWPIPIVGNQFIQTLYPHFASLIVTIYQSYPIGSHRSIPSGKLSQSSVDWHQIAIYGWFTHWKWWFSMDMYIENGDVP